MKITVCPKCGEYWDLEFCEECGYADDTFVKVPVKKFNKKVDDSRESNKDDLVKER